MIWNHFIFLERITVESTLYFFIKTRFENNTIYKITFWSNFIYTSSVQANNTYSESEYIVYNNCLQTSPMPVLEAFNRSKQKLACHFNTWLGKLDIKHG